MSPVHIHGATRVSIVKERTRSWVATSNGTRHLCLRHCTDGNVLWGLWERLDAADQSRTRYISCDVLVSDQTGWGYKSMLEHDEPDHFSCPPSYLRESPPMSRVWRDQVQSYWGQQQAKPRDFSRLATDRVMAKRFNEGDRVRYVGPSANSLQQGDTGTIARGKGPFGASIHVDELCNSVYVEWDRSAPNTVAVFASRLEHESAMSPRPRDEVSNAT
jgi:hypothetical protein